ncbi:MAG: hypothetical protein ACRDN9_14875 [Streptosporangiaceae bacterium]
MRWTDWSEAHIARHGVTAAEVEEVLYSAPRWTAKGRDDTTVVLGTTTAGRRLVVVVSQDEDEGTVFVVTSREREMTATEKRLFRRKGR